MARNYSHANFITRQMDLLHETEFALKVRMNEGAPFWIPKSVVSTTLLSYAKLEVELPDWLAEEKGVK